MLEKISSMIDTFNRKEGEWASLLILPLSVVVLFEVVMRYGFDSPTIWGFEATTFLYGIHFMLGLAYTDVTDATVFLALIGKNLAAVVEKLTALDFFNPLNEPPFLLQGPLAHVPCQCVMLEKSPSRSAILFTCSRGYAQSMVHAFRDAGAEFGLRPAGEGVFHNWLDQIGNTLKIED